MEYWPPNSEDLALSLLKGIKKRRMAEQSKGLCLQLAAMPDREGFSCLV
jgi:hypothetical protein